MAFSLLVNRNIIDVLIGDTKVYESYALPYLSGPQLCELCTSFGLPKTYVWKGVNQSRWEYMQDLLKFLDRQNRVSELLVHLLDMKRSITGGNGAGLNDLYIASPLKLFIYSPDLCIGVSSKSKLHFNYAHFILICQVKSK